MKFAVGAFSNLTQDHLDVHPSMEAYRDSKRLLFSRYLAGALRRLGIRSIAVYTEVDAAARHVRLADEAVWLTSYLSIDDVLAAAARTAAAAIHPGYGFLAENPAFAAACEQAGVVFIGPSSEAMMADSRQTTAAPATRPLNGSLPVSIS